MKKICLLVTMILSCVVTLQAFGQACTTPDNCGSTGYRPPYDPTGVYNENTTDSSNQWQVAYGRAMEAGMAQRAAEEKARKRKEYDDCVSHQKNVYAVSLAECKQDAAGYGLIGATACLMGGATVGGLVGFYASPVIAEIALANGYHVVGAVVVSAISGTVSGCNSFASAITNFSNAKCDTQNAKSIAGVCGVPPQ